MKKFSELSTRLKIAKKKANKNSFTNNKKNTSSLGTALKLSTEMVAAVLVGSIIGFILDNWFDSKPWLTIIFFFDGFCINRHTIVIYVFEIIVIKNFFKRINYELI